MVTLRESLLNKKMEVDFGPEIIKVIFKGRELDWRDFNLSTTGDTLFIEIKEESKRLYGPVGRSVDINTEESNLIHGLAIKNIHLGHNLRLMLPTSIDPFGIAGEGSNGVTFVGLPRRRNELTGWNIMADDVTIRDAGSLSLTNCTFQGTGKSELWIDNCVVMPKMNRVELQNYRYIGLGVSDQVLLKWATGIGVSRGEIFWTKEPVLQSSFGLKWDSNLQKIQLIGDELEVDCNRNKNKWNIEINEAL